MLGRAVALALLLTFANPMAMRVVLLEVLEHYLWTRSCEPPGMKPHRLGGDPKDVRAGTAAKKRAARHRARGSHGPLPVRAAGTAAIGASAG